MCQLYKRKDILACAQATIHLNVEQQQMAKRQRISIDIIHSSQGPDPEPGSTLRMTETVYYC